MSYRHRKVKSRKQRIIESLPVEQQAQELIGADWFKMSAKDQADFTSEMIEEGVVIMAQGGEVVEAIEIPEKLWNSINSNVREQLLRENLVMAEDEPMYEFTLKKIRKMAFLPYEMLPEEYKANVEKATKMGWGGKLSKGGTTKNWSDIRKSKIENLELEIEELDKYLKNLENENTKEAYEASNNLRNYKAILQAKILNLRRDEQRGYMAEGGRILLDDDMRKVVKLIQFSRINPYDVSPNFVKEIAEDNNIKLNDRQAKDISKGFGYEGEMASGGYMAEGGEVGEKVKVTFTLAGGKTVTKTYDSKADSDEGIADFMIENDVEDIKVEEEKKKSLLDIVKKVEKKGAKSKDKPTVEIDGAESDIAEYKRLNEKIKMLTADKELIGGKLKAIGKEKFVELYEQKNRTPENFLLADGDESILFMVQDKYIKVTPEKEAMLENYGKGLVETVTTYKFTELIEKKLPNGQTIGEVVVGLIMDSSVIPENDKMNLITAESVTRVPKGTIDRLMEYDNPEEVFNLIEPITALK